ncbi:low molecular weight protein arginine phosphatase [Jeotgalibacillus campisalis]|uniref:Protein-tyrosine-phosphatase n=1 Tax=Jeotgalibacillus campisalis TaxID=220754 RepID=A0A0C2VFJ4_9BACL|nr:low molecular weight protein arginine phosphatase [Jeotgalibacillus campisalis]KIL43306.1 protein-tyrosine-phosphatase [Jeotgalibacillus campisalis]
MNILFVCTGNTCRSPMAEAILKHKKLDFIDVRSAGLFAMEGGQVSQQTQDVLDENGIVHNHVSHTVSQADVHWADYVFAMTSAHKGMLVDQFPFAMDRIFTLKEFAGGRGLDVSDPFGGTLEMYRTTYEELNRLLSGLIDKIVKQTHGY